MKDSRIFPGRNLLIPSQAFPLLMGDSPHVLKQNGACFLAGAVLFNWCNLRDLWMGYALIIPLRIAYLTNSERECKFNFRMIFSR